MSRLTDIADEIVSLLNAGTWSQSVSAKRRWVAFHSFESLSSLAVTVAPSGLSMSNRHRSGQQETANVDIIIQQRVDTSSDAAIDALMDLQEEFADYFRARVVTAGSSQAVCTGRSFVSPDDAPVAKEHLEDMRLFTGVLRTTWEIVA